MDKGCPILPPRDEEDAEGAMRVLDEFLILYQPVLVGAGTHLGQVIARIEPEYSVAYKPWLTALQDLCKGVYLMARNIPIPDMERFMDALHMFTFEGAAQFIYDLCRNCKIRLPRDWVERFREHVNLLLFSVAILNREYACSQVR